MGENSQPLTAEADVRRTSRGIIVMMSAVVVVIAVIAGFTAGVAAAIAAIVGGLMAWLNFRWLDSSTRAIMVDPLTATTPILAMKYVLRYVVIAAVLWTIWFYGILPVVWVIVGLLSFAIAVTIRGIRSIFTGSQ
jgi:hypothetical protein